MNISYEYVSSLKKNYFFLKENEAYLTSRGEWILENSDNSSCGWYSYGWSTIDNLLDALREDFPQIYETFIINQEFNLIGAL